MSDAMTTIRTTVRPAAVHPPAVIGPNSVIQLGEALRDCLGTEMARQIYDSAGCGSLLYQPPDEMIDERVPAALFRQLWRVLPAASARSVAVEAGRRTGRYILERRIPSFAHLALRSLPRSIAVRLLLSAIQKNTWTFVGSGTCKITPGCPATIEIERNPLRMPGGVWHEAVFAELFGSLVGRGVGVRYVADLARDEDICRFEVHAW